MDLSDKILLGYINHIPTVSVYLILYTHMMLSVPSPAHKHTHTYYTVSFYLHGPTFLIPVLDPRNGTGTKVSLHLPLLQLCFHLPLHSSSLLNSLKRMYLIPKHAHRKNTSPPATWGEWLQSADPQRLTLTPICLWGPGQRGTARSAHLTPADEGLGASLKENGLFGSRWNMERHNAACPFHCQHLHRGNIFIYIYFHEDDRGTTFLYMKPCIGDLLWIVVIGQAHKVWAHEHLYNICNFVVNLRLSVGRDLPSAMSMAYCESDRILTRFSSGGAYWSNHMHASAIADNSPVLLV